MVVCVSIHMYVRMTAHASYPPGPGMQATPDKAHAHAYVSMHVCMFMNT